LKMWTKSYRPFVMGGSVNYLVGCELETPEEVDLGKGVVGYVVLTPKGSTAIAEKTSGAIVGTSLQDVREDIDSCGAEMMADQLAAACCQVKDVRWVSPEKFWTLYRH
jgi:hypothetical protein